MDDLDDEYIENWTILTRLKNILLTPIRFALSPALLRTYLRTILILITSTLLFGTAVIAYTSFYVAYIPVQGITVPVYLQFDALKHMSDGRCSPSFPYGIAEVKGLVGRQKYDVVVQMEVPRSRRNLRAGNWMVGVEMRAPGEVTNKKLLEWDVEEQEPSPGDPRLPPSSIPKPKPKPTILARSRRPAILTYRSLPIELCYRFLRLPLYILGWSTESERVSIPLLESVEFEKGWRNVPSSLQLDIRSNAPLEIYKVSVNFVARLEGLRWIMHTYRLTSFVTLTGLFWGVEMSVVIITWGLFTLLFSGNGDSNDASKKRTIKSEPDTNTTTPKVEPNSTPSTPRSDTSRTFPTLSSHQPLHYSSGEGSAKIKREREGMPKLDDVPMRTEAEADDEAEDEDADFVLEEPAQILATGMLTDSGIGTSMESSLESRGQGIAKRKSLGKESRGK